MKCFCGCEQETKNNNVYIHGHDRENCYPDLICLCVVCNTKVNYNRDYYEEYFMNILNERQLLLWTRGVSK